MAYSYAWNDLVQTFGNRFAKGLPATTVQAQICDYVSNDMYIEYPWKDTITSTETAPGLVPLINGNQDYSPAAPNMWRLLNAAIWNTTDTPNDVRDLDVVDDLAVDLYQRSYTTIRSCSYQKGIGQIRLEGAVNVPAGMNLEIRYEYQLHPIRVTSLNQQLWFDDKYAGVAQEGILYWLYKLGDDVARAGAAQTDAYGKVTGYSGQLGTYKAALSRMKSAEDYGTTESVFPGDVMGLGRDQNSLNIFGW